MSPAAQINMNIPRVLGHHNRPMDMYNRERAVTSGQPWLERQAAKWVQFAAQLKQTTAKRESALAKIPIKRLLVHARKMKSYDAHHSTTIEGYRITQEEADALLRGETYQGRAPADIAARMAIVGYGRAF